MKKLHLSLLVLPVLLGCLTVSSSAQTPESGASATPSPSTGAAAAATAPAAQGIDPAKAAEINKMLELTGTTKVTSQALDQMISLFKARNSDLSDEFWEKTKKGINMQTLIDKIVPLYDKYYSLDDLKAVNAFYASPAGQRMLAVSPQLMQESMQIGQGWGQVVGADITKAIEKEKASKAPAPAAATDAAPAPSTPAPAPFAK